MIIARRLYQLPLTGKSSLFTMYKGSIVRYPHEFRTRKMHNSSKYSANRMCASPFYQLANFRRKVRL